MNRKIGNTVSETKARSSASIRRCQSRVGVPEETSRRESTMNTTPAGTKSHASYRIIAPAPTKMPAMVSARWFPPGSLAHATR